jgi:TPP-dependent pyruvate/acetoin dehydrogenase alpha subunit
MPNAKLRKMYSAMLHQRMLTERLSKQQRRSATASVRGLEACLASPTIDLGPDDLVIDAIQSGAVDFLRGKSVEQVLRPDRRIRSAGRLADCGAASQLTAPAGGQERLWAAIGAAAALKSQTLRTGADDAAVLVCYMRAADVQPPVWAKALAHVSSGKLPLLLVVLPDGKRQGSRTGRLSAVALRHGVPGMPVDQHDAVALYRVAQEAIGHARIGGGGALIECVHCVMDGTKRTQPDAIRGLAEYMLHRHVADRRWMEREATSFAKRIAG